jgi:uncharacterized membrane protein
MWLVYAIAASAIWGFEYAILGRLLGDRLSPMFLLSIQSFVAAVSTGAFCIASGAFRNESVFVTQDSTTLGLVLLSTVTFTLGNFMIALSIKEGNAVIAGFVEISYPVFIILFSLLLGWITHVDLKTIIGGLIVFAGVMVLKHGH